MSSPRAGVRAASPPRPARAVAIDLLVLLALLLALVLPLLVDGAPASASQLAPDEEAEPPEVAVQERTLRRPAVGRAEVFATQLWLSDELARAYFLTVANPFNGQAAATHLGFTHLVAVDAETSEEVARAELTPRGYANPAGIAASQGADSLVVDDEGGRLLVATQSPSVGTVPSLNTTHVQQRAASSTSGQLCARPGGTAAWVTGCLDGISVLDAATLETIARIPLRSIGVDGGTFASPQLVTMSYSPRRADRPAKLHLVVEDAAAAGELDNPGSYQASTRAQSLARMALVQVDVDRGVQEWAVALDDCRGAMTSNRGAPRDEVAAYRHQAAVLRSPDPSDRAVYVGCHMVSQTLQGVVLRIPLDADDMPVLLPAPVPGPDALGGVAPAPLPAAPADADGTADHAGRLVTLPGPDRVHEIVADPSSGRLLLQVLAGSPMAEVWWVFDTALMRFVGTVGIGGPTKRGNSWAAAQDGRLYVLSGPYAAGGRTFEGGLFVADIDRTPVGQALVYRELAEVFPGGFAAASTGAEARWALTVQRLPGGGRRLWAPNHFARDSVTGYRAIEDHRPSSPMPPVDDYAGRTLDLDEADGVTNASMDGVARGYGVRLLLVGGAEAAARLGPADPVGAVEQCNDSDWGEANAVANTVGPLVGGARQGGPCHALDTPVTSPCLHGNREIVLAAVGPDGPAVVDDAGARGSANPVTIDSLTSADLETPVSRCAGQDWDQLWTAALFGRAPAPEPSVDASSADLLAECVSSSQHPTARTGDAVTDGYSAAVSCEQEEVSGHAYARGTSVDGLTVGEALSSFRIYRDPGRGIVSRVESVARGIAVDTLLRIDTVRGVAESWANGRRQPLAAEDRPDGYDPNCDLERSAGTCFQRHLFGVWTPEFRCGPCGDEHALLDGMNAALGRLGTLVQLRDPDAALRVGAENGYLAAIQKSEADRFGDLVLNNDLLQTVLPTLEIVRNASPGRPVSGGGSRGRQIYQFAGVEVSSAYGIACLLVYDAETQTCAPPSEPPASLRVELLDGQGAPLAGGAFEVRADADGDGVLGLADTLLAQGPCVTAADGVGTCRFDDLAPGDYLVHQVGAPEGFGALPEAHHVELGAGEQRTVSVTNLPDVSAIVVRAVDQSGRPLQGAAFAAYPDPDGDGRIADGTEAAATCTTGADGACRMRVGAGNWVLVQTAAPGGLVGMEPVGFAFASGGQTATVEVVHTPDGTIAPPAVPAAPAPVYRDAAAAPAPVERVERWTPPAAFAPPSADVSLPEAAGGTVVRVLRAPGDVARLLVRTPRQALAWTAAVGVFGLAGLAVRRRQLALALVHDEK